MSYGLGVDILHEVWDADGGDFLGLSVYQVSDSIVHKTSIGTIWGPQDPCGPHVGPMNVAIWGDISFAHACSVISPFKMGG